MLPTATMPKGMTLSALVWLLVYLMTSAGHAADTYELLFKEGTLDSLPRTSFLDYRKSVTAPGNEMLETGNSGTVTLKFAQEGMADLYFDPGSKVRGVGSFPADVGNPLIMYFLETVIRDLAGSSGGSPFYIRNRIKAALLKQRPVRDLEISLDGRKLKARTIVLFPFKNDPASDKMRGVETLALTFTVSEDVPGWYYSLKAETTVDRGRRSERPDTLPAYSNSIVFLNQGEAE
ncbi:hypothetical protein [Roseibium marinum]|uniref:DUF3108 domain-containing protein n=1 Tax=Roseibium marinum TaxID=281252 RepID=A0A2S3UKU1_9HYPH|nr:hypothetical protein [Roseibium marinum]POF28324.1 hypothetical protein CLV41_11591 [Roseibium marinum]